VGSKDILKMRKKELHRYHIIRKILGKELTQREASRITGLSERHIRRVVKRVREEGEVGIIHRARGKPSNRRFSETLKLKVIGLYQHKYPDFGPTLANEKLQELDGICIGAQTLRNWLMEAGEWQAQRKRKAHRQWRERRACVGEMVQLDGSHHDWLEERGPELVLLSYIDDATSRVFSRFYEYEGTLPAMESFKRYIKRYGLPVSVYLDKHTTYKSNAKPTVEELLAGRKPMSQFERALADLGVDVIHAHSPQAKGRVERLFRTLQDRLIKEMRLQGVSTRAEANRMLGSYLGNFNRRFCVIPAKATDMHRPIPEGVDVDAILSIQEKRVLRKDRTVAHNCVLYQILDPVITQQVVVEERINGTVKIRCDGKYLRYRKITQRPKALGKSPAQNQKRKQSYKPPKDHPWRGPCVVQDGGTNP